MAKGKIFNQKFFQYPLFTLAGLLALSLILSIFWNFQLAFRVVFGSFYILVLPGLVLTYVVFGSRQIDMIERIVLSFALSISVVPLLVFYLNRIGVKINFLNVCLEIFGLLALSLAAFGWRQRKKNRF